MRTIPFVDAHVHHWDLARLHYPWLTPPFADDGPNGSVAPIARTYLPTHYRADSAGWNVVGRVHVDAGAAASQALDETAWLSALDDGPDAIVAFAPLDDPAIDERLAAHAAYPKIRGVRQIVNWHADPSRTYCARDITQDDAWARGFAALARHRLSFDLQCYPGQMHGLADVIAANPHVQVIIDHLGMPVLTDPDGHAAWHSGLALLAQLPNTAVKISGFGFAQRQWDVVKARPFVLQAIELFGAQRCMVASDFPTDRLFGSFDDTLSAYAEIIADFSEADQRAMWGGNADRFYRLGILA
jgi:predicted TIM-barrel fold metal-dependent hydrolase